MKDIKIPLFIKFFAVLIILSVGPLVVVGIRTININKDALQTSMLELHTQLAGSFAEKVNYRLSIIQNEIPYVTQILAVNDYQLRDVILKTIIDSNKSISSISLLDKTGAEKVKVFNLLIDKDAKLLSLKDDETFKLLKEQKLAKAISAIYFIDNKPFVNMYFDIGKNITVLMIVSFEELWNELIELRLGKTGYAFLINAKGQIIAHKDKELVLKPQTSISIISQAMNAVSIGSSEYYNPLTKQVMIGAYAPIKDFKWSVIVEQQKNEAYYSSYRMQRQAFLMIIGSVLLSILIAIVISRSMTKPILALTKVASRIAKQDFSQRVNIKTNDEINDLISTFNVMTDELKRYDEMQVDKIVAEKTKTEAVIFSIADGIIMTDFEGKILLANKQARNMLSIEDQNIEGKVLWSLLKEESLAGVFSEVIKKYEEEDTIISKEIDLSTSNLMRFFKTTTKPVTTVKGEQLGVVTVVRDITLEKEIDRMKDDFMHSITHDLRNPMTSIRGFLKFLSDGIGGPLNEQQKKMVEIMDRASLRLMSLINDILDLAKLESGRMSLQLGETQLLDLTRRVVELLQPQIQKKEINMIIPEITFPTVLNADPQLIERVINNLVGNALKFTPEKGSITITITDHPDKFEYQVKDTGEGIPMDYIDKIFDKFQQVTGQKKGGTGLGLTICRYIVESHKGKIWVESKLKEGSAFNFYIPKNLTSSNVTDI
ncbi:MAG: hypothetical protein A2252_10675 [Elusimicrobia bacterium RIFOXYA2_FULL_39_19]|nr:MAG: hypothetical protein A2252_10675 [Elusimicrobia bacterium RIFOXYA2_FULL_39_19]